METKLINGKRKKVDIKGNLFQGQFGRLDAEDLPLSDPASVTQLVLKLDQIKAYDKNPRRLPNPEYESIKSSILSQRGLNNPFNVTRRPGDEQYMIQAGGNTRLAILRELYQETRDEVFNSVQCLFVPWTMESSILTAHLIENEMRGDMALIDKANAIMALRKELEKEQGGELSDKAFIRKVSELGYKLSRRQLNRFSYAVILDQWIPNTLRENIGINTLLDTIKNAERAYIRYCEGKTSAFPEIFARLMRQNDDEYFDFLKVRNAIEQELAKILNVPWNRLSLEVDKLLFEDTKKIAVEEMLLGVMDDLQLEPQGAGIMLGVIDEPSDTGLLLDAVHPDAPKKGAQNLTVSKMQSVNLNTLHVKGLKLATTIASGFSLEHLIFPCDHGMGFTVTNHEGQFQSPAASSIWWLLISLSQQYSGTLEGPLCQVMKDLMSLNNLNYKEVMALFENCRMLRKHFTHEILWPKA